MNFLDFPGLGFKGLRFRSLELNRYYFGFVSGIVSYFGVILFLIFIINSRIFIYADTIGWIWIEINVSLN